jgi:hypothetical protein
MGKKDVSYVCASGGNYEGVKSMKRVKGHTIGESSVVVPDTLSKVDITAVFLAVSTSEMGAENGN